MGNDAGKQIVERKRSKITGRGKGPTFIGIRHEIAKTDEFGALSGNALKLLLELAGSYNGFNNGDLSIPWSKLRSRGWRSQGTVADAKRELLESHWIIETLKGGKHRCSLYAITFYAIDASDKHLEPATVTPPHSWKKQKT